MPVDRHNSPRRATHWLRIVSARRAMCAVRALAIWLTSLNCPGNATLQRPLPDHGSQDCSAPAWTKKTRPQPKRLRSVAALSTPHQSSGACSRNTPVSRSRFRVLVDRDNACLDVVIAPPFPCRWRRTCSSAFKNRQPDGWKSNATRRRKRRLSEMADCLGELPRRLDDFSQRS